TPETRDRLVGVAGWPGSYCLRATVVMPSPIDLIAVLLALEIMLNSWLWAWNSIMVFWNSLAAFWSSVSALASLSILPVSSTSLVALSPMIPPSAWAIATSQLLPLPPLSSLDCRFWTTILLMYM